MQGIIEFFRNLKTLISQVLGKWFLEYITYQIISQMVVKHKNKMSKLYGAELQEYHDNNTPFSIKLACLTTVQSYLAHQGRNKVVRGL